MYNVYVCSAFDICDEFFNYIDKNNLAFGQQFNILCVFLNGFRFKMLDLLQNNAFFIFRN